MIGADQLSKRFGGRDAVSDVSFQIASGEVVGFLGPNGAGKTTTIRLLLGLLRPSSGSVHLDRPVGYLPEGFAGYETLSVEAQLRFSCRAKDIDPSEAIDEVVAATDLTELRRRPLGRLSKGQRQRVGLAQALLGNPPALVLDEPTIGLDPAQVVDARRLIRSAADSGAAVLFSTHLLNEAAAVCDRIVVLVQGRLVAEERPDESDDLEERFLRLVGAAQLSHESGP